MDPARDVAGSSSTLAVPPASPWGAGDTGSLGASIGAMEDVDALEVRAAPEPIAPRQYLWIIGALLFVAAVLHWLGGVLTPFLIGIIFAYLGMPVVNRCSRIGIPRTIGTLVAVALLVLLVLALVLIIFPLVQAELGLLLKRLPALADFYTARISPWLEQNLGRTIAIDVATLGDLVSDNAQQASELGLRLLSGVKTGGLVLITVLVNVALIPVVMFYLLRDGRGIVARVDELVPRRWEPVVRGMWHEIDHVLAEFLHGQMLVMISLASYYVVMLSAVGLQFAVPIGIITGLLVFIPYVGFGTGLMLGMLAALLQWKGWPGFLLVASVYLLGQLIENYILIPRLIGHRIGLHPLMVIFALLAFGQLFGFAGVLLALPASAVLLVALRRVRAAYFASPIYRTR
ncbi:MAG TPA: AI-2E family transporter [Casimicrobiaceae bacterium]|nr:AI-2E family transporter [Casimicrobiaceae bacterium]